MTRRKFRCQSASQPETFGEGLAKRKGIRWFAFRRCENIRIYVEEWIPAGCPHHRRSGGTGGREKKGGEQVRARCLPRHRGYILGPFEGCTGPVPLRPKPAASLNATRIYIYPFLFDLDSEETPPFPIFLSSLSLSSSFPRLYGWGRGVRWEAANERHGAQDLDIFARMWARCLGNCSGKRHLLIGMYQVRAEVIGCRGEN